MTCKYNISRELPVHKVTPIAQSFPLSLAKNSQNYEVKMEIKCKGSISRSSLPIEKFTPIGQKSFFSTENFSEICGSKYEYGNIFLEKRNSLLRFAADASSQKVDEFLLNKSGLVLEFLQRLGIRRKFNYLEEFPKSEQISGSRYHLHASSKTDGYVEELHETVRTGSDPSTVKEDLDKDLSAQKCSLAYEHNNSLMDCVCFQSYPTQFALESGFQPKRKQSNLVIDENVKLHQIAKNKSASTNDLDMAFGYRKCGYQAADCMLSKVDEPITLPRGYANSQIFPTSDTDTTGFQCKRRHSYLVLDKGTSHLYDENEPDSAKYLTAKCMLSEAAELIDLPWDRDFQEFSASYALDSSLQGKSKCSELVLRGISDLHASNKSASDVELSTEFECSKYGFSTMDHMLSNFAYLTPSSVAPQCRFREQSIAPFISPTSFIASDFHPEPIVQQCSLPLLGWDGTIEPELSIASDSKFPKEKNLLPLALYTPPEFLNQTDYRFIHARGSSILSSPVISNSGTLIQDIGSVSTPRPGFELNGKYLPLDFDRELRLSVHTDYQFDIENLNGSLRCISSEKRYDAFEDGKSLTETQSQFPSDILTLTRFSSPGSDFLNERSISALALDRLSW